MEVAAADRNKVEAAAVDDVFGTIVYPSTVLEVVDTATRPRNVRDIFMIVVVL